ncbi:LLM class flavin-dependent oxidoreductase [bacterium]|nr:MAG: LLM class flavin-dependent oxidoreductase [bacterium]
MVEFGLFTFADVNPNPELGRAENTRQRFIDLMEEIKAGDDLGFDVFAIGEHHRPDYAVSAPAVVLGAAASITKNIRLSSAVTVLSSEDPVRVFQQYATIDQISGGRAEIMAGRGSFIESYPLFGFDLSDYDALFAEKLELLMKMNEQEHVSWKGKHRPSFATTGIYPRPLQPKIPIWLAVGGTPESAVRAANLGLPMALAIIGGMPERFVPFANYYKEHAKASGKFGETIPLGINSHVYVAETSQQAGDEMYPHYSAMMNRIGRERGWPPMSRESFDAGRDARGALLMGSPQQIIDKLLFEYEIFGYTRFMAQVSMGTMPHVNVMKSIELLGTKVIPEVKKAIGK